MNFLRVFVSPWLRALSCASAVQTLPAGMRAARQTFILPVPVGPAHRRAPSLATTMRNRSNPH